MAIASALVERHEVDLYYTGVVNREQLFQLLPHYKAIPNIRQTETNSTTWIISEWRRAWRDLPYDAVLIQSPYVPRISLCRNAYLLCEFPFAKSLPLDDRIRLATFKGIIANSHFTAQWIERRWHRPALVLHPPVQPIPAQPKRPYILAVGRFLDGARSKRQLDMIAMFRRLCEAGVMGWELHLAGFVHDKRYADRVMRAAEGFPVHFHFNISRQELENLYSVSSIFWHAVGADVDPEERPEHMEHFGIATVEAMSAGCVPIVIARGGQNEVAGTALQSWTWQSWDECITKTRRLIEDDHLRNRLKCLAEKQVEQFLFEKFRLRIFDLFKEQ